MKSTPRDDYRGLRLLGYVVIALFVGLSTLMGWRSLWHIEEDRQVTLKSEVANGMVAVRALEEHATQTFEDAIRTLDRVAYTSNDRILLRQVYDLFDKLYERRQMIRLIGVKYSGLVHGHYQINLFDDKEEDMNLLNELDHIRNRWGAGAIGRAVNVAKEKEHDNRIMPDKKENAKSPIDPRWAKMTRRWW